LRPLAPLREIKKETSPSARLVLPVQFSKLFVMDLKRLASIVAYTTTLYKAAFYFAELGFS